jgi:hypothetical protein
METHSEQLPAETPEPFDPARRTLVTTSCAICGESLEAVVEEGVAWFATHRATKHPELPEPEQRRRRRP